MCGADRGQLKNVPLHGLGGVEKQIHVKRFGVGQGLTPLPPPPLLLPRPPKPFNVTFFPDPPPPSHPNRLSPSFQRGLSRTGVVNHTFCPSPRGHGVLVRCIQCLAELLGHRSRHQPADHIPDDNPFHATPGLLKCNHSSLTNGSVHGGRNAGLRQLFTRTNACLRRDLTMA